MKRKVILATALVITLSLGGYLVVASAVPTLYGAMAGRHAQDTVAIPGIFWTPGDLWVDTDLATSPATTAPDPTVDGTLIAYYVAFPEAPWVIQSTDSDDERESAVSSFSYEEHLLNDYGETIETDGEPDHKCGNMHYRITPPAELGILSYEVCLDGYLITEKGLSYRIPGFDAAIYETAYQERYIKIPYEWDSGGLDPAIAALTETYYYYRNNNPSQMTSVACLGSHERVMDYWREQKTDYQSLSEESFMALLQDSAALLAFFDVLHMPAINVQVSGVDLSVIIEASANLLLPQGGIVSRDALRQLLAYRLLLVSHPDAYMWGGEYPNLFYVTDLSETHNMEAIRSWLKYGDTTAMTHDTVAFEVTETGVFRYRFCHTNREYIIELVYETAVTLPSSITGGLS